MQKRVATMQALCEALMNDVYYAFSACVYLDADGHVLHIWMFDTLFCWKSVILPPKTHEVWLISHHPDGDMEPAEEDTRHAAKIREQLGDCPLYTCIANEEFGCRCVTF